MSQLKPDLPLMANIEVLFDKTAIDDLEQAIRDELARQSLSSCVKKGDRVAIAVGSRGVAKIDVIARTVVEELKRVGAEPIIVPAMGSHGGATAEGQTQVLHDYGITESTMGAPVVASMDVEQIGQTDEGDPVYFDKVALGCDGVIPVNRVKPHTDFHGTYESGVAKIMVIGLGKHRGASYMHRRGPAELGRILPQAAAVILERAPIVMGLAVVENAYDEPALVQALQPQEILVEEPKLLLKAKGMMPALPVDELDVLVVDEIGKNISGTGMDTNIIGRMTPRCGDFPDLKPRIRSIVVLDLTDETHGNFTGLGVADATTQRVLDKADFESTRINCMTSTVCEFGKLPMVCETDRQAIEAGIVCAWVQDGRQARLIRIKNTLLVSHIQVSEAVLREIEGRDDVRVRHGVRAVW